MDDVSDRAREVKQLADAIFRDRVLRARQTPPEEKLLDGARLFDYACRIMEAGIRNQFPDADDERVAEIMRERFDLQRRLEGVR
jgi:hypothetical protein